MANPEPLADLVRSYLRSAGFNLSNDGDCLIADKLIFGGERDTRLVWIPTSPSGGSYDEGAL